LFSPAYLTLLTNTADKISDWHQHRVVQIHQSFSHKICLHHQHSAAMPGSSNT